MACCDRRKALLDQLKCMMDKIPDPCPPSSCVMITSNSCCGPTAPVIEIYDPMPKPAIPLGGPAPTTPLDPTVPVPHVASPSNPCGGCCIPIITPQPVPCIPLSRVCPTPEQPCVPCNPPQMMVAYRRGGGCPPFGMSGGGGSRAFSGMCGLCKPNEIRSSQIKTCACTKRNGLQDDCPAAIDYPASGGGGCCGAATGDIFAEYQCYPAYFKMPPGAAPPCGPGGALPVSPMCGPVISGPPCVPMSPTMDMGTTPPEGGGCCTPPLTICGKPVPTVALPPCPPITVPAPPPVIPTPIPIPVPTPIYPSCPPMCPSAPCCPAPCCTPVPCCPAPCC